jgi:HTH-type transcriptional regulator/antitoxin HigA
MAHTKVATPPLDALAHAWEAWRSVVGVTRIDTPEEYGRAVNLINAIIDEIGQDETHPLAEVLDYLGDLVKAYEDVHVVIPPAPPHEVLQFLMEEHQLTQTDLTDCVPKSHLSEILSGKRAISKAVAKKLAQRFHVHADVFL